MAYLSGNVIAGREKMKLEAQIKQRPTSIEQLLTHENQVLRALPLHEGSIASAPVYPRLVVEAALRHHAAQVVFAHNHPGGVAQPSDDDVKITQTLVSVFDALAIPVVEHIIVAGPRTFSMAEAGLLRAAASHRAGDAM